MKNIENILLINFGGLGDQILFFPTINSIKKNRPNSKITFVTEPRSGAAEQLSDLIDETIICDIKSGNKYKNIIEFLKTVRSRKFDLVVSSGSSAQVAVLLWLTGIKNRIGFDSGLLSKLILTKTVKLNVERYAPQMYHELAKGVNPSAECELPKISVPEETLEKMRGVVCNTDKKIVVIHPGVSQLSIQKNILKFWKEQNWAELIKKLIDTGDYKVVLTGGKDDEPVAKQIMNYLGEVSGDVFQNMTCKTANVMELAAIIKLSNVLVCVDSAPMHIGVGVNSRTVALFGPTNEVKLFPLQNKDFSAVTVENLNCRPCLWHRRKVSCENPVCLDISVDTVIHKIMNY